jgi:hypothetical protein
LLQRFEPRSCDCEAVSRCERCAVVATARWMLEKVLSANSSLHSPEWSAAERRSK